MNPNDPNVSLLERAAAQLGETLLEQLVFVGGAVAGVLITDPAMPDIRPTQDVDSALLHPLPSGRSIRLVSAPVFLATKLEAFHGHGQGNHLFSHDLEDLMAVLDGRESLLEECRQSPPELQTYLSEQIAALLKTPAFIEALPAFLPGDQASQQRLPDLEEKLRSIVCLTSP
jgi:hypothetical protein